MSTEKSGISSDISGASWTQPHSVPQIVSVFSYLFTRANGMVETHEVDS